MSAARETAIYAAAVLFARAAPLLTVPLLAHGLAPSEYGRLEVLAMLAEFGGLLAGGGLSASVFRWAATGTQQERARAGSEALGMALLLGAFAATAGVILLPLATPLLPVPASASELRLVAVGFALAACLETPLALLRVQGRALHFAVLTSLRLALQIGLMAGFLWSGWGVAGTLAANACASAALLAVLLAVLLPRTGLTLPKEATLRRHGLYAGPLVMAGLAAFAQGSADRWIVGGTLGAVDLALYALAVKAAAFTALALRPYEMWWEVNRIRLAEGPGGSGRLARGALIGVGLAMLAGLAMAIGGPVALRLATPEPYHAAATLLPLAALTGAIHGAAAYAGAALFLRPTAFAVLWVNLAAAAAGIALALSLIPVHGLAGAMAARGLGAAVRAASFWLAARLLRQEGPSVAVAAP